jgi:hypothetical protein
MEKTEFEVRATVPLRRLFVPPYEVPGDLQNNQSRIFTVSALMGGFLCLVILLAENIQFGRFLNSRWPIGPFKKKTSNNHAA